MAGRMYDDLPGMLLRITLLLFFRLSISLLLRITLLLFTRLPIQLGMRWASPRTAHVIDEVNRSRPSGDPVLLHSQGMPAGDCPQQPSVDMLPSLPQGTSATGSLASVQEVRCRGKRISVAGGELEPFANFVFRLNRSGSTGQPTKEQLTVTEAEFGVINCCTQNCSATNQSSSRDKTLNTVFIPKFSIEACLKSWAKDSTRLQVRPRHTPEVFTVQRASNFSLQYPFLNPMRASISYQTGKAVNQSAPAFGWNPAYKDVGTNSVIWTWEMYKLANGRKLEFNKRWRGSRTSLGIWPSYMNVESVVLEAEWNITNADWQKLRPVWDVKVTLEIAELQRHKYIPGCYIPGYYSVSKGPPTTYEMLLTFPEVANIED